MGLTDFFQPVAEIDPKARIAIVGPSGVGKTFSAMRLALGLADNGDGNHGPIAILDTEGNSAAKYKALIPTLLSARTSMFVKAVKTADRIPLVENDPRLFIEAIRAASDASVLIIDSLTHAWEGTKAIVDAAGERERARASSGGRSGGGNSFALWKDASPMWGALLDAIMNSPAHIIVTIRSKKTRVQEIDPNTGRSRIRDIGMQPEIREGTEHTFDIVLDMTPDHIADVTKTRMSALDGRQIDRPDEELGREIRAWLDSVAYIPAHIARLLELAKARGAYGTGDKQINESKIREWDTPTIMKAIARLEAQE